MDTTLYELCAEYSEEHPVNIELKRLIHSDDVLQSLICHGVDNWDGYCDAMRDVD